jgi:hypothetical protein
VVSGAATATGAATVVCCFTTGTFITPFLVRTVMGGADGTGGAVGAGGKTD